MTWGGRGESSDGGPAGSGPVVALHGGGGLDRSDEGGQRIAALSRQLQGLDDVSAGSIRSGATTKKHDAIDGAIREETGIVA